MRKDDMLSQEEIDALLSETEESSFPEQSEREPVIGDYLSLIEQDAIGEIGNISFGNSATALSALLRQKVKITTPHVSMVLKNKLEEEFPIPYVAVEVKYTSGFKGTNLLVINFNDAAVIADLMLGGDGRNPSETLDDLRLSAVQEAMNQMIGSAATSMSTIFNKRVNISPPSITIMDLPRGEGEEKIPDAEELIKVSFRLIVGELIDSHIMLLLPIYFAKEIASSLLEPGGGLISSDDLVPDEPMRTAGEDLDGEMPQSAKQEPVSVSAPAGEDEPKVQPAVFSDFEDEPAFEAEPRNLSILLDVPLQVTVQLGQTTRSIKDILELTKGSIIELDKLAGEPVDILVNNHLIAKGEVVVIDENFGVRVTEIISQKERIKNLK